MRAFALALAAATLGSAAFAGDRPVYLPVLVIEDGVYYHVMQDGSRVPLEFEPPIDNVGCGGCVDGNGSAGTAASRRMGQSVAGLALPADAASRAELHARLLAEAKKRGLR